MADLRINETLCTSTVRKPCLPREGESVYLFLSFTINYLDTLSRKLEKLQFKVAYVFCTLHNSLFTTLIKGHQPFCSGDLLLFKFGRNPTGARRLSGIAIGVNDTPTCIAILFPRSYGMCCMCPH